MLNKIDPSEKPSILGSLLVAASYCPKGNRTTLTALKELMESMVTGREAELGDGHQLRRNVAEKLKKVRTNLLLRHVDSTNPEQSHIVMYYLNLLGREVGASNAPERVYMDPYLDSQSGRNSLTREEAKSAFEKDYTRESIISEAHKLIQ